MQIQDLLTLGLNGILSASGAYLILAFVLYVWQTEAKQSYPAAIATASPSFLLLQESASSPVALLLPAATEEHLQSVELAQDTTTAQSMPVNLEENAAIAAPEKVRETEASGEGPDAIAPMGVDLKPRKPGNAAILRKECEKLGIRWRDAHGKNKHMNVAEMRAKIATLGASTGIPQLVV